MRSHTTTDDRPRVTVAQKLGWEPTIPRRKNTQISTCVVSHVCRTRTTRSVSISSGYVRNRRENLVNKFEPLRSRVKNLIFIYFSQTRNSLIVTTDSELRALQAVASDSSLPRRVNPVHSTNVLIILGRVTWNLRFLLLTNVRMCSFVFHIISLSIIVGAYRSNLLRNNFSVDIRTVQHWFAEFRFSGVPLRIQTRGARNRCFLNLFILNIQNCLGKEYIHGKHVSRSVSNRTEDVFIE